MRAIRYALCVRNHVATANAGKWISLQPGDTPYQAVTAALAPKAELDAFIPLAPYTLVAPRQFHGRTVVGVSGRPPASVANGTGHLDTGDTVQWNAQLHSERQCERHLVQRKYRIWRHDAVDD